MQQTINLTFPKSWSELTDRQLLFLFTLLADGYPATNIKVKCLLKWTGLHVVHAMDDGLSVSGYWLLRHNHSTITTPHAREFVVSAQQIAEALSMIEWLDELPLQPVRVERYHRHRALAADFNGVPFEKFLYCDNLYQGYLQTQDETLLGLMGNVLYDCKVKAFPSPFRIALFYWFASLKQYFARTFPHFLQPTANTDTNLLGSNIQPMEAMNAQIRALTKGDATKEKEVLALDTWRALTELNAQAKEYEEFNKKYPS